MWDEIQDMPGEIFDVQVQELNDIITKIEELEAKTMMSPPESEEFTNNFTFILCPPIPLLHLNFLMDLSSLLIIIGMVILSGWVVF